MANRVYMDWLELIHLGLFNSQVINSHVALVETCKVVSICAGLNAMIMTVVWVLLTLRIKRGGVSDRNLLEMADFFEEANLCTKRDDDVVFLSQFHRKKPAPNRKRSVNLIKGFQPSIKDVEEICVLCQVNEADVYVKPCEHTGMCMECIEGNAWGEFECPVCGEPIDKLFTIQHDETNEKYIATPLIVNQ